MGRSIADVVVIADDLSGAAEAAAALVPFTDGCGVSVLLKMEADRARNLDFSSPIVIDTNSRANLSNDSPMTSPEWGDNSRDRAIVVKKVDSLLRGDIAAEVAALRRRGQRVLMATALPEAARIVRRGHVLVNGVPLRQTATWQHLGEDAFSRMMKSFSKLNPISVPLDVVRSRRETLTEAIGATEGFFLCDAETEGDLERIAAAALHSHTPPLFVGSAGLVAAIGHNLAPTVNEPRLGEWASPKPRPTDRTAFIVGTAEPSAHRQLARLEEAGCEVLRLEAEALLSRHGECVSRIAATLEHQVSAIALVTAGSPNLTLGAQLVDALAVALGAGPPGSTSFVLTGGQTARAVLDAWGTRELTVCGAVAGAAWGVTDAGTVVATRPGSFGGDDGLLRILDGLRSSVATHHERQTQ